MIDLADTKPSRPYGKLLCDYNDELKIRGIFKPILERNLLMATALIYA